MTSSTCSLITRRIHLIPNGNLTQVSSSQEDHSDRFVEVRQPKDVHAAVGDSSGDTHEIAVSPAAAQSGPGWSRNLS